jgi:2-polyprenyl-6-methoxyphenol hydroxylase-like FAD-dependent oxidoreductase
VDVIIIGAGIGGLATALALDRVGIKARIYETVEELRPLGVGINLLPQLGECGLLDALADTAIKSGGSRAAWRRAIPGRNSRSIAAICRRFCCAPRASGLAKRES